ncbi:epoxyqueuosine reductase QueH [Lachnospiraceae bacterium JLR.KK008]
MEHKRRNYQRELEQILSQKETKGKRLFLHSCCAPCSSYVLVYLREFFRITVFYYNPNITDEEEYRKRAKEQKRLIAALNEEEVGFPIRVQEGCYDPQRFLQAVKGLEQCPEGQERCRRCFALRLGETAKQAAAQGFDYMTTTLTISPLKNAQTLNEIGQQTAQACGTVFLPCDFKKKEGYKQSIELSRKYDLYRQDYCGCVFSREERDRRLHGDE